MAKALTARVLKATTLLSSTQVLSMGCSVIRNKLLSLWVGELGVGLMGALTQAGDLIGNVSQLSFRTTAVPGLASAAPSRRSAVLTCVRRYGLLLGMVGFAVMFLLAPWISQYTFGSQDFGWAYRVSALSLLFISLQNSELVALQGAGEFKSIAASGLITAAVGLLVAMPLFFLLRSAGVPFALVGYALTAWLAARWYGRRQRSSGPRPSWASSLRLGRGFIVSGALLTLTTLITDGVNFVFIGFVGQHGGDMALGHFQAGYTMLWRYAGAFFIAFAMEFYPRLSRVAHSRRATSLMLTHQAMVFTLLLIPFAAIAIALAPWLVRILYRESFMPLLPYFIWGMAAMTMRPLSVSISYSFLAAERSRVYTVTEVLSGLTGLGLNIAGYSLGGFLGLGFATIAWLFADLTIILCAAAIVHAPLPRGRAIVAAYLSPPVLLPLCWFMSL